jgi:2,3-dihydroxybiphenyl 1,2-dioxygenase
MGYIGFEVSDLDAWERFAVGILGLQVATRTDDTLTLRMDDRVHRILLTRGLADDLAVVGFECATAETLDALVATHTGSGVEVADGDAELAARRGVERLAVAHDPAGNRVELYVGLAAASTPFASALVPSGFATGDGGAGHAFLPTADRDAMVDFYARLGFTVSDYVRQEVAPGRVVDAVFTHCNPRHHTLAFAAIPFPKRVQHLMIEVNDHTDVGTAYDRVLDAKVPIAMTIGMHPNDLMFSFYVVTPSGFALEFGSGGRRIEDEAAWEIATYDRLSTWGHRPAKAVAAAMA